MSFLCWIGWVLLVTTCMAWCVSVMLVHSEAGCAVFFLNGYGVGDGCKEIHLKLRSTLGWGWGFPQLKKTNRGIK
jgi:hypothetical protein